MAESMKLPALAPEPDRRPAARKPRIPHPPLKAPAPPGTPEDRTGAAMPPLPGERRARPSGQRRGHASGRTPAERMLRTALRVGLVLNAAALVIPRFVPVGWRYGTSDFLLAGAVLLSGYALLAVGRLGRRDDRNDRNDRDGSEK